MKKNKKLAAFPGIKHSFKQILSINIMVITVLSLVTPGQKTPSKAAHRDGQETMSTRVDRIFAAYDRKDSPGCALAVYQSGKIVYGRGYGMADLQAGIPIRTNTVFDIGSTSKQFTAASIFLLAQRGKLSLDDDVRRYIPELPQYQKPITIRHMLHHTSGLRDYPNLLTLTGTTSDGRVTIKQEMDAVFRQKALNFDPGAEFLYSNSGYLLLSQIVKRVSGKTLAKFAKDTIFAPLNMRSTSILSVDKREIPNLAIGYVPSPNGFQVAMSNWEQVGSGGVHTSVNDLFLWDNNFYKPKVGGKKFPTEMQAQGILNNGTVVSYAGGLIKETFRGLNAVSHSGLWVGYHAELIRFPDHDLSVSTLCNVASANAPVLARAVAAVYLEDKLMPIPQAGRTADTQASAAPVTIPSAKLQDWAGTYLNSVTGSVRVVTLVNGKLLFSLGPVRVELSPQSESEFTTTVSGSNIRLVFERTSGTGVRQIRQFVNGRESALFAEVVPPGSEALASYAGKYFSEELNTTWTISAQGGALQIHNEAGSPPISLIALSSHLFSTGGELSLKFIPDPLGRSTNFEVSLSRARNIKFVKTGN